MTESNLHAELKPDGGVLWTLQMSVRVPGIELPFRLKVSTDDEEAMLEALSDFQSMILDKVESLGG